MVVQKGYHCAYETHSHLVFPVKYRKALLLPEVEAELVQIGLAIQDRYPIEITEMGIEITEMGVDLDHIHLLCSAHPKYGPGDLVRIYKSITDLQKYHCASVVQTLSCSQKGVVGR